MRLPVSVEGSWLLEGGSIQYGVGFIRDTKRIFEGFALFMDPQVFARGLERQPGI